MLASILEGMIIKRLKLFLIQIYSVKWIQNKNNSVHFQI